MPETTPHPSGKQPWENGWLPDTSRAPGTRRLWLAGGLAMVTIVACAAAILVNHQAPDAAAAPVTSESATDDGPGLLSFASPSSSTTAEPKGRTGMSSVAPDRTPASAKASESGSTSGSAPSAEPSESAPGHHGSSGSENSSATSLRSVNYPDRYWHLSGGYVKLDPIGSAAARRDATFRLVDGLADASCYSFATADGSYLRHRSFVLRAERADGSALFRQDATFCPRASAYSGAVMLESVNYPGRFLRHRNFQLRLDQYQSSDLYRADSAFRLTDGLA